MSNTTVEIVKINPKLASEMLENVFEEQRPVVARHITRLAGEMKAGKWRLSSDCIVSINGKVANGQHRLQAVVVSETTQPFLLMTTDDAQLYKVLDCGKTRSVADVIQGEYASLVASVARGVMLYDYDAISLTGGGGSSVAEKTTRSQIVQFAETNHKMILECGKFCSVLAQKFQIIGASITTTLMFIAERDIEKPKKIRDFIQHLYDGNSQNDAAHDLRERILRSRFGAATLHRNYLLAISIKSFNAYLKNTRLGLVKMNSGEAFPRLKK